MKKGDYGFALDSHGSGAFGVRGNLDDSPRRRTRLLQVSPGAAIGIAAFFLVIAFQSDPLLFGLSSESQRTVSSGEAVDISLQRFIGSWLAKRLESDRGILAGSAECHAIVSAQLKKVRKHSLYIQVWERMAVYLRGHGFETVPLVRTLDPAEPTISTDADATMNAFFHTWYASLPASSERIGSLVREQEKASGPLLTSARERDRHAIGVMDLLRLAVDFPDDLGALASDVRLIPRPTADVARERFGVTRD